MHEENSTFSMSRLGNWPDNVRKESFFATLKKERMYRAVYATRSAARASVFDGIERFANRTRRHSALGSVMEQYAAVA